jgi:Zn-dependent peptidase ImmA (M78 family)
MSTRDPGPFLKSEFIPDKRIQRLALEALQETKLLPATPKPIAVDKFCDRKWGVPEDYEKLAPDVMGYAAFTCNGFDRIVINSLLDDDQSPTGKIRIRSTTAHEIGHAVLHTKLFIEKILFDREQALLFGAMERQASPNAQPRIVCREMGIFAEKRQSPWWEIQANRFMAAMLMPKPLFLQVVEPTFQTCSPEMTSFQDKMKVVMAIEDVKDAFNVSREMARIAVETYLKTDRAKALEGALL